MDRLWGLWHGHLWGPPFCLPGSVRQREQNLWKPRHRGSLSRGRNRMKCCDHSATVGGRGPCFEIGLETQATLGPADTCPLSQLRMLVPKYHRLGGLNLFLRVQEAGEARPRCQPVWLLGGLSLAFRWSSSCCVLTWWRQNKTSSLVSSHRTSCLTQA